MTSMGRCLALAFVLVVAACKDIGDTHTTTIENRTDFNLIVSWKDDSGSGGGEARIGPGATVTKSFHSRGKCAMMVEAGNLDELQPGVVLQSESSIAFTPDPWCYEDTLNITPKPTSA